jgi:hypothetical protein
MGRVLQKGLDMMLVQLQSYGLQGHGGRVKEDLKGRQEELQRQWLGKHDGTRSIQVLEDHRGATLAKLALE